MPREGYTNLTINDPKRLDRIHRDFDQHSTSAFNWSDWIIDALDVAIKKEMFLKTKFPNIRFVGKLSSGYIIEDTKKKQTCAIKIENGKYVLSPDNEAFREFALLHPNIVP